MSFSVKLSDHCLDYNKENDIILEKYERNKNIMFNEEFSNQISNKKGYQYQDLQMSNFSSQLIARNKFSKSKADLIKSLEITDKSNIDDFIKIEKHSEICSSTNSDCISDSSISNSDFVKLLKQINSKKGKRAKHTDKQKVDFTSGFHKLNALRNHDRICMNKICNEIKGYRVKKLK